MPKFKIIRDKEIFNIPEELIEVCDTRPEIINYGCKELIKNILLLQESDFRDLDILADTIELLYTLGDISFLTTDMIDDMIEHRLETHGEFSKYLKREI
jgi:hypothetical protein